MDLESTIKIEEEIIIRADCLQDVIKIKEETLDSHHDEPSLETEDGDLSAIVYIKCEVDDAKLENGSTSDDWTVIENSLKDFKECPLGTLDNTSQEAESFEQVACSSTEINDNGQNDGEQIGYNNNSSVAQLKVIKTAKGDKLYSWTYEPSPTLNQFDPSSVEVSLECPVCKKTYDNKVSLKRHFFRIHSAKSMELQPPALQEAATEFSKNTNKIDLLVNIGSNNSSVVQGRNKLMYPCSYCTKSARTPRGLTNHVKKFHPTNSVGAAECNLAAGITTSSEDKESELFQQVAFSNITEVLTEVDHEVVDQSGIVNINSEGNDNKLKYPCSYCTKSARSPVALTSHVKNFHPSVAGGAYFECQDCNMRFKTQNSLCRHRTRFHSGKNVKRVPCPRCDATFSTNSSMKYHVGSTHEGEKLAQCSICQKKFSSNSGLKYHMLVHQGIKKFACSECEMRFTSKENLKHHTKTIHSKEKPSYQCHECGRLFKTERYLKSHLRCHSSRKVFTFPCLLCTMWFKSSEALEKHQFLHAGQKEKKFECQNCNRKYASQIALDHHAKSHLGGNKSNHVCDICDATFPSHVAMMAHVEKHAPERPYFCPKCFKEYSNKGSFMKHVKKVHSKKDDAPNPDSKDGRYHCSKCKKSFGTRGRLSIHEKFHSLKRNLKCRFCSKQFKQTHNLNDHERIHSGLKPYSCNECDRTFVTLNALKYHLVLHSKRRPYQCSVCKFRFKCMSHLNGHIKVMKGHKNAFAVIIEDDGTATETKGDQSFGEKDSN